ncbi:MAG: hypothetical protein WCT28_00825 [Patescibacteria group bacterium]
MSVKTILLTLSKGNGSIFGLINVTSRQEEERERLLHIVSSHLEVMKSDITSEEINIPRRFESMLVTLNADLARFAGSHNVPLKNVNIIVGVMTNTQVFFSGTGTNHALFLHRTAERRYVIYELDLQLASQENTWEKPLITVLDGELHAGDVFYVATRVPPHALSLSDLQDILVTLPPNGALERIQQFVPVTTTFGSVCFHINDDAPIGPPKKGNPMASLSNLEETKTRTADLLGDQTPDIAQKIVALMNSTKKILMSYSENAVWRGVKRILREAINMIESLLRNKSENKPTQTRHLQNPNSRFAGLSTKIIALRHAGITAAQGTSRTTKIVGIIVAIICIIIIVSIGTNRAQQRNATANATYESLVTKIEEKRTTAEASIIYGNTQDAQILLTDAKTLIATLPRETSAQETKAEYLLNAVNELLGKTRGLETVIPTIIATLPAEFAFPLIGMTSAENAIYGVAADAAPWRVNEINKLLERVDINTSPAQNITIITSEGENILSVDMDKRLWRTTTGVPSVTSLTSGMDSMSSVEDFASYNDNIYALSSVSGQIIKMRPQGLNFEAGTPWISAKTSDLSQTHALAIDGNVWILSDNDVVKFASGKEIPWDHATIDPSLEKPIDIWTDVDSKYLYILDGKDGRVLVMDKEGGGIVAQYIANISGIVGFTVRESENRILLSTATTIYSYTASHLLK